MTSNGYDGKRCSEIICIDNFVNQKLITLNSCIPVSVIKFQFNQFIHAVAIVRLTLFNRTGCRRRSLDSCSHTQRLHYVKIRNTSGEVRKYHFQIEKFPPIIRDVERNQTKPICWHDVTYCERNERNVQKWFVRCVCESVCQHKPFWKRFDRFGSVCCERNKVTAENVHEMGCMRFVQHRCFYSLNKISRYIVCILFF